MHNKSIKTDVFLRVNEIFTFTACDSNNENYESNMEITTYIQDAFDTAYILSDKLCESSISVTTKSEQSDIDKDEKLERYSSNDPILD